MVKHLHGMTLKGAFDDKEFAKNAGSATGNGNDKESKITLRKIEDPNAETAYDQLNKLSVKELNQYLHSKNIDPKAAPYNCIEKEDLIKSVNPGWRFLNKEI